MNPDVARAWNWAEAGLGDLPGVGPRLSHGAFPQPEPEGPRGAWYFDLATPYFASKYVLERLELGEDIFPNLRLSLYPGGHMFYTRADARRQFYNDARALYETPSVTPAR
jgi:hypothetical protein